MAGAGPRGERMAKDFAKNFYRSSAWKKCRASFIISKHGLCERCNCKAGTIVHHKIYLTPENINDPNITLSWKNLEVLCQDCHNEEHHGTDATADGLTFDEDGNLIQK